MQWKHSCMRKRSSVYLSFCRITQHIGHYTVGRKILRPPSTALFFLSFFALWKATFGPSISDILQHVIALYICYSFQFCISFNLYFPKKRKDTHEVLTTKNYPYRQRKCRLSLLKNTLISGKVSRMFWNILVEIYRAFTMNRNRKLDCQSNCECA